MDVGKRGIRFEDVVERVARLEVLPFYVEPNEDGDKNDTK